MPARFRRYPENADGPILVRVFRIGAFLALRVEFRMFGFESVGYVLQEDQTEYDMLALRCVHVVAQRVGSGPELGFEAEI